MSTSRQVLRLRWGWAGVGSWASVIGGWRMRSMTDD